MDNQTFLLLYAARLIKESCRLKDSDNTNACEAVRFVLNTENAV